jgi:hypothetical protein
MLNHCEESGSRAACWGRYCSDVWTASCTLGIVLCCKQVTEGGINVGGRNNSGREKYPQISPSPPLNQIGHKTRANYPCGLKAEEWSRGCGYIATHCIEVGVGLKWAVSFTSRPLYHRGNIMVYRDVLDVLDKLKISWMCSDFKHDIFVFKFVLFLLSIQRYPRVIYGLYVHKYIVYLLFLLTLQPWCY